MDNKKSCSVYSYLLRERNKSHNGCSELAKLKRNLKELGGKSCQKMIMHSFSKEFLKQLQKEEKYSMNSPIQQKKHIQNFAIDLDRGDKRNLRSRILMNKRRKAQKNKYYTQTIEEKSSNLSSKIDELVRSKNKVFGLSYFTPEGAGKKLKITEQNHLLSTIESNARTRLLNPFIKTSKIVSESRQKSLDNKKECRIKQMIKASSKGMSIGEGTKEEQHKERKSLYKKFTITNFHNFNPFQRSKTEQTPLEEFIEKNQEKEELCGWEQAQYSQKLQEMDDFFYQK